MLQMDVSKDEEVTAAMEIVQEKLEYPENGMNGSVLGFFAGKNVEFRHSIFFKFVGKLGNLWKEILGKIMVGAHFMIQ